MEPKQYPANDSSEQDAKTVLESLVDSRYVKLDIKTRDKYPNVDGTVEIVDERGLPKGKFDIQLRTIPKERTSYSCEVSLVAYSKVSTLPVLLVCVDSENERAYWKHVNPNMPELKDKETQHTFTIHFSSEIDIIDQSAIYIRKWLEIAGVYQKCIEQYPSLSAGDIQKFSPEAIDPSELGLFQEFIETINNLLDNDFRIVKEIIFPGIWKLGVGIVSSSEDRIQYRIYSIPYKDPASLVCKLTEGFLFTNKWDKNAITESHVPKDAILNPQKAGIEFVEARVVAVLKSRLLHIYGLEIASDTLFSFIDRYYPILGIEPRQNLYSVYDLSVALNHHLLQISEAALVNKIPVIGRHYDVDLDKYTSYLRINKAIPTGRFDKPVIFSIGTDYFPISTAYDSLRYLIANGENEIIRSFELRDTPLSPQTSWIWSGYSKEREIKNATYVLENSLSEYKTFVEGNKLRFPNSPFLDPEVTIIYEYETIKGNKFEDGPGVNEYHLKNPSRTLPKLIVYSIDNQQSRLRFDCDTEKQCYTVEYNGNTYEAISISYGMASFIFDHTPILNQIYRMLSQDLSTHYGITRNIGLG